MTIYLTKIAALARFVRLAVVGTALMMSCLVSLPASASDKIQGTITVTPALQKQITPGSVLYVIARDATNQGPPVAVVRIDNPKFPQAFTLGSGDLMSPGVTFKGPYSLTAKLSKTGNPMTSPGDLLSTPSGKPVKAGATGAQIALDKQAP